MAFKSNFNNNNTVEKVILTLYPIQKRASGKVATLKFRNNS